MGISQLPLFQTKDDKVDPKDFLLMQNKWKSILDPVLKYPLLSFGLGKAGQIFTSSGPSSLPKWADPAKSISYAWSGYQSPSAPWTVTSATFADFGGGGVVTKTEQNNKNFGAVNNAPGNLPGLSITFPVPGLYYIGVTLISQTSGLSNTSFRLMDDLGSIITPELESDVTTAQSGFTFSFLLSGLYSADGSTRTIKIRGTSNNGTTLSLVGGLQSGISLMWNIFKVAGA